MEGRNRQTNLLVYLKAPTLLRITPSLHSHREEGDVGRRHGKIGWEHDLSVVNTLLVGSFRGTANSEMPFEIIVLLMIL